MINTKSSFKGSMGLIISAALQVEVGWGIIYKARNVESGAEYALKMSREQLAQKGINELYEEMELVRRIDSQSVIQYLDYGYHNQRPVLVMELIESPTLSSLVAERGAELTKADKDLILSHLFDAVETIHQSGVIHCDLKPQNVIVHEDLTVKVVDFGLAKDLGVTGEALSQYVGGTPHFMAPEQLTPHQYLSPATDIYALTLIVIWLFSPESSWERAGFELLQWRMQHPSALPTNLDVMPEALRIVLRDALQLNPQDRPDDVATFKRRLHRALAIPDAEIELLISPAPVELSSGRSTQVDSYFNTTFIFTEEHTAETFNVIEAVPLTEYATTRAAILLTESVHAVQSPRMTRLRSGICEDLIDLLNVSESLEICRFSESKMFTLPIEDLNSVDWMAIQEHARALSVEYLLYLSVERDSEAISETLNVRVNIFAVADSLLIARREERYLYADILNQLGGLAVDLARSLKITLNSPRAQRTSIADSIDLLFAARSQAVETWHTDVSEAIALYYQAIALAPEDAVISAEAARVVARASFIGSPPRAEALESATSLAERAHTMTPNHPQTLWALGYVRFYQSRRAEALILLERALLFGGERAEVRDLIGRILTEEGPIERALQHLEHAHKMQPQQMTTVIDLARIYAYLAQWERVDELLSIEPLSESDYGAREITRARLNLWRTSLSPVSRARDREREGPLFSILIDIFRETRESGQLSTDLYQSLNHLFTTAPQGTRLAALYSQFIVECIAFTYGPHDDLVREALDQARDAGVTDELWFRFCPLLSANL